MLFLLCSCLSHRGCEGHIVSAVPSTYLVFGAPHFPCSCCTQEPDSPTTPCIPQDRPVSQQPPVVPSHLLPLQTAPMAADLLECYVWYFARCDLRSFCIAAVMLSMLYPGVLLLPSRHPHTPRLVSVRYAIGCRASMHHLCVQRHMLNPNQWPTSGFSLVLGCCGLGLGVTLTNELWSQHSMEKPRLPVVCTPRAELLHGIQRCTFETKGACICSFHEVPGPLPNGSLV